MTTPTTSRTLFYVNYRFVFRLTPFPERDNEGNDEPVEGDLNQSRLEYKSEAKDTKRLGVLNSHAES